MITLEEESQFNDICSKNNTYIVIKFGAEWCKPCKKIAPHYESYSENNMFNNTIFCTADVDEEDMMDLLEKRMSLNIKL